MPSLHDIPSRREHHCSPCPHHKMTNAMFGGPGNVWREYNCMHSDAFDDGEVLADPFKEKIRQRLIGKLSRDGRHIGRTEKQPDWCPLKRQPPSPLPSAPTQA